MSLLKPSRTYKPFAYPWAYDYWLKQQQIHWLPEEVPLGEDIRNWSQDLLPTEKNLLTQIFRFFTQADLEVQNCYMKKYSNVFQPVEVGMMLTAFSNMETVHMAAYSHLLDTVGMPESEYGAFLEYDAMRDKHDYLAQFGMETNEDILTTLAMFGGFTEGVQLFASFAMLLNFQRRGLMKGMGQIVTWSVRDESLHCEGISRLFREFARETGALTNTVRQRIYDHARAVVEMEDRFIDLAFELGPVEGMTAEDTKRYVRFVTDWRLRGLGLEPIYGIEDHPLPWLVELLNGVEHANFFEQRATEYSKGATRGSWEETWAMFDKHVAA
jgi:ribonucleoside-diphosphate reductase beta chain